MKLRRQGVPFTQIANEIFYRKDISFQVKGLFGYLFSKPETWDFAADRIAEESTENRKTIQKILKQMEVAGLLKRKRLSSGKMEYTIEYTESQSPLLGLGLLEPKTEIGSEAKVPGGKLGPISNKDKESNKEGIAEHGSADIPFVIDLFKEVNPSYRKFFGNKTQRAAVSRLIEIHGVGKVSKVIAILPKTNKMKFVPIITSPLQLEDGWARLESSLTKNVSTGVGRGLA